MDVIDCGRGAVSLVDGPDYVTVYPEVLGTDSDGNRVRKPGATPAVVRGRMSPLSAAEAGRGARHHHHLQVLVPGVPGRGVGAGHLGRPGLGRAGRTPVDRPLPSHGALPGDPAGSSTQGAVMASVYPGTDAWIAHLPGVKAEVHEHGRKVEATARALLASHRQAGDARIEGETQDTDYIVSLVDPAALSIEYGRGGYTTKGGGRVGPMEGLQILGRAAGI